MLFTYDLINYFIYCQTFSTPSPYFQPNPIASQWHCQGEGNPAGGRWTPPTVIRLKNWIYICIYKKMWSIFQEHFRWGMAKSGGSGCSGETLAGNWIPMLSGCHKDRRRDEDIMSQMAKCHIQAKCDKFTDTPPFQLSPAPQRWKVNYREGLQHARTRGQLRTDRKKRFQSTINWLDTLTPPTGTDIRACGWAQGHCDSSKYKLCNMDISIFNLVFKAFCRGEPYHYANDYLPEGPYASETHCKAKRGAMVKIGK